MKVLQGLPVSFVIIQYFSSIRGQAHDERGFQVQKTAVEFKNCYIILIQFDAGDVDFNFLVANLIFRLTKFKNGGQTETTLLH